MCWLHTINYYPLYILKLISYFKLPLLLFVQNTTQWICICNHCSTLQLDWYYYVIKQHFHISYSPYLIKSQPGSHYRISNINHIEHTTMTMKYTFLNFNIYIYIYIYILQLYIFCYCYFYLVESFHPIQEVFTYNHIWL